MIVDISTFLVNECMINKCINVCIFDILLLLSSQIRILCLEKSAKSMLEKPNI